MFELFFAIIMALSCPSHNHNNSHKNGTTVSAATDSGGDEGHVPPVPPPHP